MSAIAKTTIPSLENTSPIYAAAVAKIAELHARLNQTSERIGSVATDLNLALIGAADHSATAATLVAGGDIDDALAGNPSSEIEVLNAERVRLAREREILIKAVAMATAAADSARGEASAVACAALKPRYRELVSTLVDAVLAAYQAHAELEAFASGMDSAGVSWSSAMRPVTLDLFRLIGRDDQLPAWLRDCRKFSLTTRADPEQWTAAWTARAW